MSSTMSSALEIARGALGDTARAGSFKYLAASVQHSLFRNGKVLTRRDRDGSDGGWDGVDLEAREMPVHDARALAATARRTLARNGFEVRARSLASPDLDFFNHAQVVETYYPQCAEIVAEASGASFVAAFDHNVRSAAGKQGKRRRRATVVDTKIRCNPLARKSWHVSTRLSYVSSKVLQANFQRPCRNSSRNTQNDSSKIWNRKVRYGPSSNP